MKLLIVALHLEVQERRGIYEASNCCSLSGRERKRDGGCLKLLIVSLCQEEKDARFVKLLVVALCQRDKGGGIYIACNWCSLSGRERKRERLREMQDL